MSKTREIKFRAWDTRNKEMHQVTDVAWELDDYGIGSISDVSVFMAYEFGPIRRDVNKWFELMQFTGLKDKNGKDIYEGDILRIPSGYHGDYRHKETTGVVEWETSHNESGFWINAPDDEGWKDCEVIGNIYENHELLEKQ